MENPNLHYKSYQKIPLEYFRGSKQPTLHDHSIGVWSLIYYSFTDKLNSKKYLRIFCITIDTKSIETKQFTNNK